MRAPILKAFLAALVAVVAAPLSANPESVAPEGWSRSVNNEIVIYQSNPPGEAMAFRTFPLGSDLAEQVELFTGIVTGRADRIVRSEESIQGPARVHEIDYTRRGVTMASTTVGVRRPDGSVMVVTYMAARSNPAFDARAEHVLRRMSALAASEPRTLPRASTEPAPAPSSPAPTGTGPKVERVLFDLSYNYGVGGAAYPVYHLVALLEDGTAVRLGSYALDDINVAAIRRDNRGHVGTWRRNGREFAVRWADGDTSDLKPNVGPPATLPSASQLRGTYQAVGGGGNTAFGGQTLTAQVKQLTFNSDGTFTQSSSTSASSPAAAARASSANRGRWQLNGANLTLSYANGRVLRTTVFYSGNREASARGGRYGVLWIGGEDYRRRQ